MLRLLTQAARSWFKTPRLTLTLLACIAVSIGGTTTVLTFVYSLLLRATWSPVGSQKIVDHALYDGTPILFAALWALMPHGTLQWRDIKWALIPPAIYLAYALARGAIDGWYPYYFLNPSLQTGGELALSIAGVLAVLAIIAACAIAVDMRIGRGRGSLAASS